MLRPGHAVAVCVLALLMVGIVMVNSAGMTIQSRETFTVESILLSRTSIYAGLALLAMIACAFIPVRRLIPAPPGDLPRARPPPHDRVPLPPGPPADPRPPRRR